MASGKTGRKGHIPQSEAAREADRFRELKKRYLRVCRENARLRKELSKYETINTDTDEETRKEVQEMAKREVLHQKCQECGEGEMQELRLPRITIRTCSSCGYREKER